MRRARELTEADRAVWAGYAQGVARRVGVADVPMPAAPAVVAAPVAERAVVVPPRVTVRPPGELTVGTAPGGLDASSWGRFRAGKMAAVRVLDLHGQTAQRAHAALGHFLAVAAADGVRCVEVITGRGRGEGGVIRREFPLWLNQPGVRGLVLAAAHPHVLNPGSVRLLLRRVRR